MPSKAVRQAVETLERAVDEAQWRQHSQQPRFSPEGLDKSFTFIRGWVNKAMAKEPEYSEHSKKRDAWLSEFWRQEPHWAGVINQCVLIDSNRSWELIGGRNQVYRYTDVLRYAEGGKGWRRFMRKQAQAYRIADMCAVTEVGRDGPRGPMRALYAVDPTKCTLTGNIREPLEYTPKGGNAQRWRPEDFFRIVSMPSTLEEYFELGYCATSRAADLVRLLYAILEHDLEKAGARMPKGIMLMKGITQKQWGDALEQRKAKLDAEAREYFGGLFVLAGVGTDAPDAKLVALSQLPDQFDRKMFIDMTMYGYALVVGMDPTEFWPVQFGAMGRGQESTIQHQKATTKGAMDFAIELEDQIQQELPDTLYFQFEARDDEGDLLRAQVLKAWAEVGSLLYTAGAMHGRDPLVPREQVLSLLVEEAHLPAEWTDIIEDTYGSDKGIENVEGKSVRERMLTRPEVRRAISRYEQEPIIRYRWPDNRETVLWESGAEALRRSVWTGAKIERQDDEEEDQVLYEGDDVVIRASDVQRAIQEADDRAEEYASLLVADDWAEQEERGVLAKVRAMIRGEGGDSRDS